MRAATLKTQPVAVRERGQALRETAWFAPRGECVLRSGTARMPWWLGAAAAVALVLCALVLAGCATAGQAGHSGASAESAKKSVVCANYPAFDWLCQILGRHADEYEVVYLLDNGSDVHSFQPSVADIARIADADLFVYVGGETDRWIRDTLSAVASPKVRSVDLLEAVGDAALEEELVEGMQGDGHAHDHDHAADHTADHDHDSAAGTTDHAADHDHDSAAGTTDHAADHDHDHDGADAATDHDDAEYDEHVWLSLKNAQVLVGVLAEELCAIDPQGAPDYRANAQAYQAQLAELETRYVAAVASAQHDTLLFADRFPFRYLLADLGLNYYAAFQGCSAETEASFETIVFLAQKLDELGLGTVLVIEGSDEKLAQTVVQTSQAKTSSIAVLDSLQSVSARSIAQGKSYVGTMQDNLAVIEAALA